MIIYLLPFALQGILIFWDEFYFHRKRGLPLWEKLGHPLDTLTVFVCYAFMLLCPPIGSNPAWLVGLMVFSCLFITKDEFVHTEVCNAWENWLHAMLFVVHPISFVSAFLIWKNQLDQNILVMQASVIFAFMLYQLIYWRYFEKRQ
jgi:hypothetical protein